MIKWSKFLFLLLVKRAKPHTRMIDIDQYLWINTLDFALAVRRQLNQFHLLKCIVHLILRSKVLRDYHRIIRRRVTLQRIRINYFHRMLRRNLIERRLIKPFRFLWKSCMSMIHSGIYMRLIDLLEISSNSNMVLFSQAVIQKPRIIDSAFDWFGRLSLQIDLVYFSFCLDHSPDDENLETYIKSRFNCVDIFDEYVNLIKKQYGVVRDAANDPATFDPGITVNPLEAISFDYRWYWMIDYWTAGEKRFGSYW